MFVCMHTSFPLFDLIHFQKSWQLDNIYSLAFEKNISLVVSHSSVISMLSCYIKLHIALKEPILSVWSTENIRVFVGLQNTIQFYSKANNLYLTIEMSYTFY